MVKICPHNSTGRADYFGAVVNRAARLLVAAKPGQVLIEEQVMESVIREWTRTADTVYAAARPLSGSQQVRPSLDLKRLVNFSSLFQPTRMKEQPTAGTGSAALALGSDQLDQRRALAPQGDAFELSSRSRSVPLNAIRRMNGNLVNAAPSKVTFEGLGSAENSPRQSLDGNSRLGSLDLVKPSEETLESCCPPYAAKNPLAVSNCHMLKFLQTSGPVLGRNESGVWRGRKYLSLASRSGADVDPFNKRSLLTPGNSLDTGFKLPLLDKQLTSAKGSLASKGWVHDQSRNDSESSAGISSAPSQKGKM